jgi:dynein heavy chain, axonemal
MKKCFEGIAKLDFDTDRVIQGMISSENEVVKLSQPINPHLAKGCVEKWLLEVRNYTQYFCLFVCLVVSVSGG